MEGGRRGAAQSRHGQLVAGIEHRRHHAQRIADQGPAARTEIAAEQHDHAGQRRSHADDKQHGRVLAEQQPGGERDKDRRQIGEQRCIGHRGQHDGPVPYREIAGGLELDLRLENVSVAIGGCPILTGIDAAFHGSRVNAVIGPNGSGKSTLLRAVLGAVPKSSGRVFISGREAERFDRREMARTIALVPQDTHLDFSFTVDYTWTLQ